MLKTLAISTLLLGSTIAFAQPAAARDREDYRNNNNNRDRDHYAVNYDRDRRADHDRDRDGDRDDWRGQNDLRGRNERPLIYAPAYSNGYYDRFGNSCAY